MARSMLWTRPPLTCRLSLFPPFLPPVSWARVQAPQGRVEDDAAAKSARSTLLYFSWRLSSENGLRVSLWTRSKSHACRKPVVNGLDQGLMWISRASTPFNRWAAPSLSHALRDYVLTAPALFPLLLRGAVDKPPFCISAIIRSSRHDRFVGETILTPLRRFAAFLF